MTDLAILAVTFELPMAASSPWAWCQLRYDVSDCHDRERNPFVP